MIIVEDLRVALILAVLAAIAIFVLSIFSDPKPDCPVGTEARTIHSTWYCVAPPVKS